MALVFAKDAGGGGESPIAIGGGVWLLFGTLTFSGTYPTNGDPIDLTKFFAPMGVIRTVIPLGAPAGFGFKYDVTNKKLLVYVATAVTPAAAEHAAAAYHALLTAAAYPVAFLVK